MSNQNFFHSYGSLIVILFLLIIISFFYYFKNYNLGKMIIYILLLQYEYNSVRIFTLYT